VSKEMNKEEVQSMFGDVELTFSHYHKYCFTYVGHYEHGHKYKIVASFGGSADDIYRFEVCNNDKQVLSHCLENEWNDVSVYQDDELVFNWSDY
jgi:hypothetical protein